jgi:hypothetical protein
MPLAPAHHRRAEERHPDHDVDLRLVGAEEGEVEDVAADDIGEVDDDRDDEGERQRLLDRARQPLEDPVDVTLPSPSSR